eukprot:7992623-Ditylum_brightwellii.AAC.1
MATKLAHTDQPPSNPLQTEFLQANEKRQIDELYPDHAEALSIADLAPPTDFPVFQFQKLCQDDKKWKKEPIKYKRSKWDQMSVSMAYRRFLDVRENFSRDLSMKLNCD